MFAGNLQGITQTLPLLIYQDFEVSFDLTLAISSLLIILSGAILLTVKLAFRLSRHLGPDA
jgi:molybdate transport system permease protein